MAFTGELRWDEGPFSVENQSSSTELRYIITSDDPSNDNRDGALFWLASNAPSKLYGLTLNRVTINEQILDTNNTEVQERKWDAVVEYINPERKKPKPIEVNDQADPADPQPTRLSVRSSAGGSRRRLYSRKTLEEQVNDDTWNLGINDWEPGRLLNLRSEDAVDTAIMLSGQGIDVPIGLVEMVVETVRLNEDIQTNGYLVTVAQHAANNVINEKVYKGFPVGTLKLINFIAKQRGGDDGDTQNNTEPWDVTYTFQYQAESSAAEGQPDSIDYPPEFIGNPLTLADNGGKLMGWQYLDITYTNEEVENATGDAKIVMPKAVRIAVHDIYKKIDFAAVLKI